MKTNNLLDERQEQVLLKIEHNGYLIAFWGADAHPEPCGKKGEEGHAGAGRGRITKKQTNR